MAHPISLEKAQTICRENPLKLQIEYIALTKALNRTLAEDLTSLVDDPAFNNSAMDGWAVRSRDKTRMEIGTIGAGDETTPLNSGEAIRIMTGAPMPPGADAIVLVEDGINGPAHTNYIRKRGENIEKGSIALFSGQQMTPASISLAATMGYSEVPVFRKPRVAVISTGKELIEPGKPLSPGQIYESNSFGLCALLEKIGCTPIHHEIITDSLNELRDALNNTNCDAIITSGGVSMGEFDFVRKIMEDEGEIHFWKVAMRPGGPPLFGTWNDTPLFGLPGNPVSSHVVFMTIVAPWLNKNHNLTKQVRVRLKDAVKGAPKKVCLRRILIEYNGDELSATTSTHQGSGNIHSMVAHNGLTLLPPDTDGLPNQMIDALWFS